MGRATMEVVTDEIDDSVAQVMVSRLDGDCYGKFLDRGCEVSQLDVRVLAGLADTTTGLREW